MSILMILDQQTCSDSKVLVHLRTLRHFSQERQCHASRCGLQNHGKTRVCEGAHDDT
jgi:hypothetical protein